MWKRALWVLTVGLLLLLALVLLPSFSVVSGPSRVGDASHLADLVRAVKMYVDDWRVYPHLDDPVRLKSELNIRQYVPEAEAFQDAQGRPFGGSRALAGRPAGNGDDPDQLLFYAVAARPDGRRMVARLNGSVRWVGPAEWDRLARDAKLQ